MSHQPRGRYTSFESILHRVAHERMDKLVVERAINLVEGSAAKDTAADTAAAYYEAMGFVRGLREAQRICDEVAQELARDG